MANGATRMQALSSTSARQQERRRPACGLGVPPSLCRLRPLQQALINIPSTGQPRAALGYPGTIPIALGRQHRSVGRPA